MKIYDFLIRQVKLKSFKDAVVLLWKLLLIAVIADETYNAIHILPCRYNSMDAISGIFSFLFSRILFFLIIYLFYRLIRRWKRNETLKRNLVIFVIIGCLIWILNGSIFFIYYIDGPYWGKVVDADTGEPIVGANVMGMWIFDIALIQGSTSFADARETVTDEKGRFLISPARQIWFYPISDLRLEKMCVYKSGYDSHPPQMQGVWSEAEKEKWKEKLIKINPNYYYDSDPSVNYYMTFYKFTEEIKLYKQTTIRLNKALSIEEKMRAKSRFDLGDVSCDTFKIKMFDKALETTSEEVSSEIEKTSQKKTRKMEMIKVIIPKEQWEREPSRRKRMMETLPKNKEGYVSPY
jgi:hypothetical protein